MQHSSLCLPMTGTFQVQMAESFLCARLSSCTGAISLCLKAVRVSSCAVCCHAVVQALFHTLWKVFQVIIGCKTLLVNDR